MALTRLAHQLVREHFSDKPKGLAIDATCGNGHDTEFLAKLGFQNVIGFDVQATAIENTRSRLHAAGCVNVNLVQRGHEHLKDHVSNELSCAMFNFGYLPNADKSITTMSKTSVMALSSALSLLTPQGLICLICYPGHEEGALETKAIQNWLRELPQDKSASQREWQVKQYLSNNPKPEAPILYTIIQK